LDKNVKARLVGPIGWNVRQISLLVELREGHFGGADRTVAVLRPL
jgi:hypothetical protein